MHYWIFGIVALIFFVASFNVGIKKKLYLISNVNNEDLENINNADGISKIFGLYYFFLGILALLAGCISDLYGLLGMGISIVVLMALFFISIVVSLKIYFLK